MRDAIHVQKFRRPSETLDEDQIITESAAREVLAQKALRKTSELTAPRASVAAPQHLSQPRRVAQLQGGVPSFQR
jgi:hypothetical protein